MPEPLHQLAGDPETFFSLVWPGVPMWERQHDILRSFRDNFGTVVHSAVEMGKDWIVARLLLWFYATRFPCKVLATSTSHDQLRGALWGEIGAALRQSKIDLGIHAKETWELRRKDEKGRQYEDDWLRLKSAKDVESLSGIHLAPGLNGEPTVAVAIDEASGVKDDFVKSLEGQAHRLIALGNPLRLAGHFVDLIKAGDQPDPICPDRLRWKIIGIDAEFSPNVQAGMRWDRGGRVGPCPVPLPGIMGYGDYLSYLKDWDSYHIATRLHGRLAPPGGTLFARETFRYFREEIETVADEPQGLFVLRNDDGSERRVWQDSCWWFQTCDTAYKEGRENDYTVVLTACITPLPACLLFAHVRRERLPVPRQFGMLMDARGLFPRVQMQAVEDKASGIGLIQEGRLRGTPFRVLKPGTQSKVERATAVLTAYQNGLVYHKSGEPWLGDFEDELLTFPCGKHDDQVDTASYGGIIFQERCFQVARGREEFVCYPVRAEEEGDEDRFIEGLSLAEQLTGRRPGSLPRLRQFGIGGNDE